MTFAKTGIYNLINVLPNIVINKIIYYLSTKKLINNDEDNITSSSQSSDSDCLDNLESLSDEELIACGVAQGWVDEKTGIVTPPDSQTNSTNQESSSSNVQNYDLNLTIFF